MPANLSARYLWAARRALTEANRYLLAGESADDLLTEALCLIRDGRKLWPPAVEEIAMRRAS